MNNTFSYPYIFSMISGKSQLDNDIVSIETCLKLLLLTSKGELLGDPMFGTNINKYIYDINNIALQDILRTEIVDAINAYEKRVRVLPEYIYFNSNIETNTVNIIIKYIVVVSSELGTFELSLINNGGVSWVLIYLNLI